MAKSLQQLIDARAANPRAILFECSSDGLYSDFPGGNVFVRKRESDWIVMPRAEWRAPMKTFASALAAFNYARHAVRA